MFSRKIPADSLPPSLQILTHLEAADAPCTLSVLTNLVYPDLHPDLISGAQRNLLNHLEKLEEENRISKLQLPVARTTWAINYLLHSERITSGEAVQWKSTSKL